MKLNIGEALPQSCKDCKFLVHCDECEGWENFCPLIREHVGYDPDVNLVEDAPIIPQDNRNEKCPLEERMTRTKLNEITTVISDAVEDFLDMEKHELLNLLVSLHNELYKEVTGKYYDYMYHWANLGYGGDPDDGMFKEESEK